MANPFQSAAAAQHAFSDEDEGDERQCAEQRDNASSPPPQRTRRVPLSPNDGSDGASSPPPGSPMPAATPADLNTASVARLAHALGRSSKLPAAIIADRDANGPFRSMHDLQQRIRGLGKAKLQQLQQSGLFIDPQQAQSPQRPEQQQRSTRTQHSRPQSPVPVPAVAAELMPAIPAAAASGVTPGFVQQAAVAAPSSPIAVQPAPVSPVAYRSPSPPAATPSPPPPAAQTMDTTAPRTDIATAGAAPSCWCCCPSWCCCCSDNTTSPVVPAAAAVIAPSSPPFSIALPPSTLVYGVVESEVALVELETDEADTVADQMAGLSIRAGGNTQPLQPAQPHPVGPPVPPELVAQCFSPPPSSASSSGPTLRVGSWNLQHFNTRKAHDHACMRVVSDVIVRQRFDVLVLLEVRSVDAVEMLLSAYLNNPQRDRPAPDFGGEGHSEDKAEDDGCGHWRFVISDAVQYGSDASQPLPSALAAAAAAATASASSAEQVVLDIVDEGVESTASVTVAPPPTADALAASLSSMSLHSTPARKPLATSASTLTSPVSPQQYHHRRGSGGSTGSGSGSGFKWAGHKKREYYAFVYRSDRVELPFGCRLYQTASSSSMKAGPPHSSASASHAGPPAALAPEYRWWRSPCYALVRPLPSLLASAASSASAPLQALQTPPLEWLLCALHVVWGDGEFDVLSECAQLQPLYCSLVGMLEDGRINAKSAGSVGTSSVASAQAPHSAAITASSPNVAVALLGDFNLQSSDARFNAHCLPLAHFTPLVRGPPHSSTFSERRAQCNLYDQIFVQNDVLKAASGAAPALHSGVCYYDALYFASPRAIGPDDPERATECRLRLEAKRTVSDHRPVFSDLPARGDVRGRASRHELQKLLPVPPPPPPPVKVAAPSSSGKGSVASSSAPASASSSAAPLSSLLSIVVTTSAVPIHPSTVLLDTVLHSFTLMPELADVRIVVMCDAPKVVLPDKPEPGTPGAAPSNHAAGADWEPSIFKRGVMTESRLANYRAYVSALRARYPSRSDSGANSRVEIVELDSYAGFGWALRVALEQHVHTPYVLVVQHDYIFAMPVPIGRIVAAMHQSHEADERREAGSAIEPAVPQTSAAALPAPLRYVGFVHRSTQQYLNVMTRGMPPCLASDPLRRVFHVREDDGAADAGSSSPLPPLQFCPLLFWYDKPHLASRSFYLESVLSHPRMQPRGTFPEDEFGVARIEEMRAMREGGAMQHWARTLGAYLYQSDERGLQIALRHLNGRRFEKQRIGGLSRMLAPSPQAEGEEDASDAEACHNLFEQT